mmetsp:Transcript_21028/g.53706  ORF Transcript_21028/g.53706 Transcript_21028/m.53706 type:complete len:220 (+) Transcript_21028:860-1519(+)
MLPAVIAPAIWPTRTAAFFTGCCRSRARRLALFSADRRACEMRDMCRKRLMRSSTSSSWKSSGGGGPPPSCFWPSLSSPPCCTSREPSGPCSSRCCAVFRYRCVSDAWLRIRMSLLRTMRLYQSSTSTGSSQIGLPRLLALALAAAGGASKRAGTLANEPPGLSLAASHAAQAAQATAVMLAAARPQRQPCEGRPRRRGRGRVSPSLVPLSAPGDIAAG